MYLSSQDLAFRGHDETENSVNKGNFRELVDLFCKYDSKLRDFMSNASVFAGTSKTIQNELLDSINYVLRNYIEDELLDVPFFSWQVDETTDITCKSQLSIIFRFVKNGQLVERFLGFYDVSSGRTAVNLFNFFMETFQRFDFANKLIAQTYDGASVMAGHLNGLQTKIKSVSPQAIFTHCYAHNMNLVLSNACSSIKEVRIFFPTYRHFQIFLANPPNELKF